MNKTKIWIFGLLVFVLIALIAISFVSFWYSKAIWPLIVTAALVAILEIAFALRIAISSRSAYAKACWILLILVLPIIGLIVFFIFGVNPLRKRQRSQYLKNQSVYLASEDFKLTKELIDNHKYGWLFAYGYNNMAKPVYKNNKIEIIDDNTKLFEESIKLIRSAKQFINVQSFIFKYKGFWARIFFAELIKKANQGVKVRVLYDWMGSWHRVKPKVYQELRQYGIEVACFNPKGFTAFKGATNYRLHSKFIIIDNKVALYGGSNFADEYLSMARYENHWKDLNYLISGPIVNSMNITFINYWLTFTEKSVDEASKQNIRNDAKLLLSKQSFDSSNVLSQLLVFEPDFNAFTLENTLLDSFYNAKKSIKIISPYFCPPNKIIEALKSCHEQGIKIEIITHSKNQKYVQMVNRDNLKKVIEFGIKAYEYDGYLHSKLIIIDDDYVLTGSCNVDYRSIYLDFESELIVYDEEFSKNMTKYFEQTKQNATLQTPEIIKQKASIRTKFLTKVLNIGKSLF